MDQLHIDLWMDGINVLCDCGTYSYADPKGAALALVGAHNAAKIEEVEQMNRKGAFLVYNRTQRCHFRHSEKEFLGKVQSKNGYTHQRHIKKQPDGYAVYDTLATEKTAEYMLILHTPCNVCRDDQKIKIFSNGSHILTVEGNLEFEIRKGIRSLYYLTEEPVSQICFRGTIKDGVAESLINLRVIKQKETDTVC